MMKGSEEKVVKQIRNFPKKLYAVSVKDFENAVNTEGTIHWVAAGHELHVGEDVTVSRYESGNGDRLPDFDGLEGVLVYRFRNDGLFVRLNKPPHGYRVFRDGVHVVTVTDGLKELPLQRCQIA